MSRYVVYEVWTASRIIEAPGRRMAYEQGEPKRREGLNLSNWHIVKIPEEREHGPLREKRKKR